MGGFFFWKKKSIGKESSLLRLDLTTAVFVSTRPSSAELAIAVDSNILVLTSGGVLRVSIGRLRHWQWVYNVLRSKVFGMQSMICRSAPAEVQCFSAALGCDLDIRPTPIAWTSGTTQT